MCTVIMGDSDGNVIYDKSYETFDEAWDRRLELAAELDSKGIDVWVADEEELQQMHEEELYA